MSATPTSGNISVNSFPSECQRIRDEDRMLKRQSNLVNDFYPMIVHDTFVEAWETTNNTFVKIVDVPGTLSGQILRLRANIPQLKTHCEIKGGIISPLPFKAKPSPIMEDAEPIVRPIHQLPLVTFDEKLHFAKECRAPNEVDNLLRAKGHPNVVELLGQTEDGKLVFPRYLLHPEFEFFGGTIPDLKRVLLQLADAVIFLHSKGIVHRDLNLRNILFEPGRNVILCDLESQYGSAFCPEIAHAVEQGCPNSDLPYSEKSDVFCFGTTMAEFILSNNVRTPWQFTDNFRPPAPFDQIVQACIRREAAHRPTMQQVRDMLLSVME
ncbi:hypothetical protein D9757_011313 [Collybiopsis confluens]|uniref:Protein kinase domain-containing protein n=1 Tax=Collybiopsis confluens TaxID=2823264 RepID=A0A8H5GNI6_9AGAR|nr:hypothetical protein D9757_011313 [Collybiopsis confluens]